jgi:hypothetical protein
MLNPPGIIDPYLPKKNKYTNFKNIETIMYNEISDLKIKRFLRRIWLF